MSKNVLVTGVLIVFTIIFSAFIAYKIEYEYYKNIYDNDVDSTVSLITKKIQSVSTAAETTASFFSLKGDVTQEQFNDFASVINKNISSSNDMPTLIEWVDTNNIVQYVYPLTDSSIPIIGLDLNQYPNRLNPIIEAKNAKSTMSSNPMILVEGYPGILIYSPIFRDSEYRGQIIISVGLFNILDLSTKESTAKSENIYLQTENLFIPFYKNVIYNDNNQRILNYQGELIEDLESKKYYKKSNNATTKEITFLDKKWQIIFSSTYIEKTYKLAIIYTIVSFIFVLEIFAFVYFVIPLKKKKR